MFFERIGPATVAHILDMTAVVDRGSPSVKSIIRDKNRNSHGVSAESSKDRENLLMGVL